MATATLTIDTIYCPSCALLIDQELENLPGVILARTDMGRSYTRVEYDPDATNVNAIAATIAGLGFTALAS